MVIMKENSLCKVHSRSGQIIINNTGEKNQWYYINDNNKLLGLTLKLENPSNPTSGVYDSTFGWNQTNYIIPENITSIDTGNFLMMYYDKEGNNISNAMACPPTANNVSVYLHDGINLDNTINLSINLGKLRLPNNLSSVFQIVSTPMMITHPMEEITVPPLLPAIINTNFGTYSFGGQYFPNLKTIKFIRNTSSPVLYFGDTAFSGTAIWTQAETLKDGGLSGVEFYFNFDESEINSKIQFESTTEYSGYNFYITFYEVFKALKENGQIHFNADIINN